MGAAECVELLVMTERRDVAACCEMWSSSQRITVTNAVFFVSYNMHVIYISRERNGGVLVGVCISVQRSRCLRVCMRVCVFSTCLLKHVVTDSVYSLPV